MSGGMNGQVYSWVGDAWPDEKLSGGMNGQLYSWVGDEWSGVKLSMRMNDQLYRRVVRWMGRCAYILYSGVNKWKTKWTNKNGAYRPTQFSQLWTHSFVPLPHFYSSTSTYLSVYLYSSIIYTNSYSIIIIPYSPFQSSSWSMKISSHFAPSFRSAVIKLFFQNDLFVLITIHPLPF